MSYPRSRWDHLLDIPEPVRKSLAEIFSPWAIRDDRIDAALDLLVEDNHARQQVSRALRLAKNRHRIPELCGQMMRQHPHISHRQVFRAISLFLGLNVRTVQRRFYGASVSSAG